MSSTSTHDLVAADYEGRLVGFAIPPLPRAADEATQRAARQPIFAMVNHAGCIRAAARGGALLATGGTDNTIAVYNLRRRRFHGKLTQQGGGAAVNCLAFCGESHLISAAEDGSLCIWRTSDWECLLTMRGHKGAVHDVSVHPSGRLALSVAADRKLMLWNLLTGKCNYTLALPAACRLVRWTPAADAYALALPRAVQLFDLASGALRHALAHDGGAPLALAFAADGRLATGGDDATLRVWDVELGACAFAQPRAHERRIKALAALGGPPAGGGVVGGGGGGVRRHDPRRRGTPPPAATAARAAEGEARSSCSSRSRRSSASRASPRAASAAAAAAAAARRRRPPPTPTPTPTRTTAATPRRPPPPRRGRRKKKRAALPAERRRVGEAEGHLEEEAACLKDNLFRTALNLRSPASRSPRSGSGRSRGRSRTTACRPSPPARSARRAS